MLDLSRLVEQGSPPRMRGKEVVFIDSYLVSRITPAYAGKRFDPIHRITFQRDHPRVCGEKITGGNLLPVNKGSPPRMRGKACAKWLSLFRFGITPAYAGKSSTLRCGLPAPWDHPRVCGEKAVRAMVAAETLGSPPRMRGKADDASETCQNFRITPAYAGKRLKRSRSTVPPVAIVPLFPSVCNKPVVSDGSPAGRDAPLFLPAENAVPASPAYNLRSL